MRKRSEQICKGHVNVISVLLSFFAFSFKHTFLLFLFFLLFSILNFDVSIYFYILILWKVFGKYKLGSSTIDQIGKTAFAAEFLTVANTLD